MTHKEIIEEADRRYVGCHSNPSDASKHDGFVKGAQWATEQDIEAFEKFLDRYFIDMNKNQGAAWRRFKRELKGEGDM